jgi:Helix-turn-helix domain
MQWVQDRRYVADGSIITSTGISPSVPVTVALVEAIAGREKAERHSSSPVADFSTGAALRLTGRQPKHWKACFRRRRWCPMQFSWATDISSPRQASRRHRSGACLRRAGLRPRGRAEHPETGMTPARLVELVRLDRAKQLLETTRWPLARVANRSGLGSAATLARTFRRRLRQPGPGASCSAGKLVSARRTRKPRRCSPFTRKVCHTGGLAATSRDPGGVAHRAHEGGREVTVTFRNLCREILAFADRCVPFLRVQRTPSAHTEGPSST